MSATRIEWADRVWNPVTGCTKCSPACDNCYAERVATTRLAGRFGYPADDPFRVTLHENKIEEPLSWKKPVRIFVGSMTDLFHEGVKDEWLERIFAIMSLLHRHTFMLLTKRPERMLQFMTSRSVKDGMARILTELGDDMPGSPFGPLTYNVPWPLPNVWLGTTIWDQASADRAVPILLNTPAAKRFVSVEPMLGPLELPSCIPGEPCPGCCDSSECAAMPDWVICGGETGPGARPMHPDWPRSLRDQCQAAGVPFFFKQWGEWGDMPYRVFAEKCVAIMPDGQTFSPDAAAFNGEVLPEESSLRCRVGTRRAGRALDGRTWEEVPNA